MSHMASVLATAALVSITTMPVRAQVFADLKSALVDYSRAGIEPRKPCEALGSFKLKEIAQIGAAAIPASSAAKARSAGSS